MADLDNNYDHNSAPPLMDKKPTIVIKIRHNVIPQKVDCDDDPQKRGIYKFHAICKLNQKRQHPKGSKQLIQSFLSQRQACVLSPTQGQASSYKQNVTPQSDQYSESTNDNSLDEAAVKESTYKSSHFNSPNLDILSLKDISVDIKLPQNGQINQNNYGVKCNQAKNF
ncbi:hypothetical protein TTHERM_00715660 (macronuclear) [Tetrahymena thermophila SB210]|uniref:Uncharacterized protein n=1 Tax=Tetrahymena thermophila (strain SB210) TaxID=312017 RepID=I7M646_TETTS|nr:hypothetical protein TTHERM_00715660 [Tetrahymena thermophila SB210]EAR84262.3 hypothetical protein TTHERM_00715660 [Tetrahymena thermophila SB210]|eukprot:XP_001031925.3 hypothetical protein TTHERM_00715660 [Tetrahymena thermophila SB210]